MKTLTYKDIKPYIESGLVNEQVLGDLRIFNYSKVCQFDRKWDDVTIQCRGLIMRGDEIVARPFRKFFNLGEVEETKIENLPAEMPQVTEKFDGSLGILYFQPDGRPAIATRGSFTSDQALRATEMLRNMPPFWNNIDLNLTYLFEILYPENRVVVNYGNREELVLIGLVNRTTGEECTPLEVKGVADRLGLKNLCSV